MTADRAEDEARRIVEAICLLDGEAARRSLFDKIEKALREAERRGEQSFIERLSISTQNRCSCGGSGPSDPGACPACEVYHDMKPKALPLAGAEE